MFERFTEKAIKVIMLAQEESRRLGHNFVGSEQLLLGLIGEGTGIAAKALKSFGISLKQARIEVEKIVGRGDGTEQIEIPFTPGLKQVMTRVYDDAASVGNNWVGTEHLLLALVRHGDDVTRKVLENSNVDPAQLETHLFRLLGVEYSPQVASTEESLNLRWGHTVESGDVKPNLRTVLERCTLESKNVFVFAQDEASRSRHNRFGTEHLLLGLMQEVNGVAARTLMSKGLKLENIQREVERETGKGQGFLAVELPLTPRARKVFEYSLEEAQLLESDLIGTEHLLLALIRYGEGIAIRVLYSLGVDPIGLRQSILKQIERTDQQSYKIKPAGMPSLVEERPRRLTSLAIRNKESVFERFTEKAIKVIMLAQEESRRLGHNFVGTEQILLGLIGEGTGTGARALKEFDVRLKDARIETEKIIGHGSGFVSIEIPFTPRSKRLLELSWDAAQRLNHNYIATEHLLLGLIKEGEGVAARVLENMDVNLVDLEDKVFHFLNIPNPTRNQDEYKTDKTGGKEPTSSSVMAETIQQANLELKYVILHAEVESRRLGHKFIGTEQLLLGLISAESSLASQSLHSKGLTLQKARHEMESIIGRGPGIIGVDVSLTPRTKRILLMSQEEAKRLGGSQTGAEHLLLAILAEGAGVAIRILEKLHIDIADLRKSILTSIEQTDAE